MIEVDQETQHESETIKGRGYDADVSLHVSPCFLAKDASLILILVGLALGLWKWEEWVLSKCQRMLYTYYGGTLLFRIILEYLFIVRIYTI